MLKIESSIVKVIMDIIHFLIVGLYLWQRLASCPPKSCLSFHGEMFALEMAASPETTFLRPPLHLCGTGRV